jgi:hypothetical protein
MAPSMRDQKPMRGASRVGEVLWLYSHNVEAVHRNSDVVTIRGTVLWYVNLANVCPACGLLRWLGSRRNEMKRRE